MSLETVDRHQRCMTKYSLNRFHEVLAPSLLCLLRFHLILLDLNLDILMLVSGELVTSHIICCIYRLLK